MRSVSAEERLAKKYEKFGISFRNITRVVNSLVAEGLSHKAAIVTVRMELGNHFNVPEYFTADEIAEITGSTTDQVIEYVNEHTDDLLKSGIIAEIKSTPHLGQSKGELLS